MENYLFVSYFDELLLKLIRNSIDLFDVIGISDKLKLDLSTASDFSGKKLLLQRRLILDLLKVKEVADERLRLEKILETVNSDLC